jgi:hypothetical protein
MYPQRHCWPQTPFFLKTARLVGFTCSVAALSFSGWAQPVRIDVVLTAEDAVVPGHVEFIGVEAGAFNPAIWQAGTLNLVPDQRHPFMAPLSGKWRNIYAPSAVETPAGYRVLYGAWDGIPDPPKDRLYSGTADFGFSSVQERKTIVMPGGFGHICNVNAIRFDDGSYRMFGTVEYSPGKNRPAFFSSDSTGTNWNGTVGEPYTVQAADFITIAGYTNASGGDKFPTSDINGINVMVHEDGVYRLYFGDFMDASTGFKMYRATSANGRNYTYEGVVLNQDHRLVNDLKKFRVGSADWYLMGLHFNGAGLWYSLSTNGLSFPTSQLMLNYLDEPTDRYIVAMGWVVKGAQEQPGRKVTGVLYGAGPVVSLDRNSIFARWLQKKVVFVASDGARYTGAKAFGPDRQLVQLPGPDVISGHVELYSENGLTLLGRSYPLSLRAGQRLQVRVPEPAPVGGLTNSGVAADGQLLASGAVDPHYKLIVSADPLHPGPAAYVVNEPLPATTWITNGPTSKWIAPVAHATNLPGSYVYRTEFELASELPETATITVKWAAEFSGTNIFLNGVRLNPGTTFRSSFSTVTVNTNLVSGANSLDFYVRRSGTVPARTGLRVELSGQTLLRSSFTLPTLLTHPLSHTVKHGTNISFSASAIGSVPFAWQWFKDDAPLAGQTNAVLNLTNLRATDAGQYAVRVSNPAGSVFSAAAILEIIPPEAPLLSELHTTAEQTLVFKLSGSPGDIYLLESSTNLVDWIITRMLTNSTGTIWVAETMLDDEQRYFKVRVDY